MNSILFLHGGALNKSMWEPQLDTLSDEFNVYAIDLPGHGKNSGTEFTLNAAVESIHKFITKLSNGKLVIVGLSLGGYVAIAYAHKYPDNISKLILSGCNTRYFGLIGFVAKLNQFFLMFLTEKRFTAIQMNALKKVTSNSIAEKININGISKEGAKKSLNEIIGTNFASILEKDTVPILLINGEKDWLNIKYGHLYLATGGDISTAIIKNCGHLCNLENPDTFTYLVRNFILKALFD